MIYSPARVGDLGNLRISLGLRLLLLVEKREKANCLALLFDLQKKNSMLNRRISIRARYISVQAGKQRRFSDYLLSISADAA